MDPKYKTSIIKEINNHEIYKENEYPYYIRTFLYSRYPDEKILEAKLNEINKGKYPIRDNILIRIKI